MSCRLVWPCMALQSSWNYLSAIDSISAMKVALEIAEILANPSHHFDVKGLDRKSTPQSHLTDCGSIPKLSLTALFMVSTYYDSADDQNVCQFEWLCSCATGLLANIQCPFDKVLGQINKESQNVLTSSRNTPLQPSNIVSTLPTKTGNWDYQLDFLSRILTSLFLCVIPHSWVMFTSEQQAGICLFIWQHRICLYVWNIVQCVPLVHA